MTYPKPENLWLLKLLQSSSVLLEMHYFPPLGNVCRNITVLYHLSRGEITHHLYLLQLPVLRVVSLLLLFVLLWDSCREFLSPWDCCFSFSTWDKGQWAALIWKSLTQLEPGGSTPHPTLTTPAKCQALPAQHCCCHPFQFCNVQTAQWRSRAMLFEQPLHSRIFPK